MTIRKVVRNGESRLVCDIVFRKKDGTKGRYRKDAQVQTMAAARAEERRIVANLAQYGEPFEPQPEPSVEEGEIVTFKGIVEIFRKGKAITKLKPTTRSGYEEILTTRLIPRFGSTPIVGIGFQEAEALDATMAEEGLSASRRRNVLVVLRSVLGAAVDAKKLKEMPKLPSLPKVGKKVLRALTREQVEKILSVSPPSHKLAFGLAAYAGLRAGEVRGLRWGDVDLEAGIIVVRVSHSHGAISTPKSGHEREIPIAASLRPLLGAARKKNELVATTSKGEAWGEYGLLQAFQRAQTKVGLSGWRFHDLRHYFCSEIFRRGGSAPAVQALAGHSHLATTERYAHVIDGDLEHTIGLLNDRGNSVETGSPTFP